MYDAPQIIFGNEDLVVRDFLQSLCVGQLVFAFLDNSRPYAVRALGHSGKAMFSLLHGNAYFLKLFAPPGQHRHMCSQLSS